MKMKVTILFGTGGSTLILSRIGCRPCLTARVSVNSGRTETKTRKHKCIKIESRAQLFKASLALLVVKILTVLVSNSQVFLLKNVSSFCKCKSCSHFFSKNISVYAIFNDQSFNDTFLTTFTVLNNWAQVL